MTSAMPSGASGSTNGATIGPSGPAEAIAAPRPLPATQSAPQLGQPAFDGPSQQERRAAWQAYNGVFEDGKDGPLAAQPGVPDLNVRSNRIRPVVNTGVDFLFGPSLKITVADDGAQAILDACWGDDDERMTKLSKAALTGGVYGHVFVKVVPPAKRKGPAGVNNPPRLVLLNPETVNIETDPEDADLVARFTIEYATTAPDGSPIRKRQTITRSDPDDDDETTPLGVDDDTTWIIQNWTASGMSSGRWLPDGPALIWPYELPPIIDWQNYPNPNSHWGQRDATDGIISLNRQLRLVESNINKIGFLQGHPFLWSSGADTGGLKPTPGQIIDLGAADAKLAAVSASGDLAQLMAFAEQLRSDMDEESGVPGVATGRLQDVPKGQMSGVTVRLLYSPLLARNEHKRRLYGDGIRQVCQTALLVCGWGMDEVEALNFELGWQDPLPQDDLALAQTAMALKQIGYSQHTLIINTGGDPDTEADYLAEEQQRAMDAITKGQGMPPAPPAGGAPPRGRGQPPQNGVDPNHPAAQAAQVKAGMVMKAAFGKPADDGGKN